MQEVRTEAIPPPPVNDDGSRLRRRHGQPNWRSSTFSCSRAGAPRLCACACCILILIILAIVFGIVFSARIPDVVFQGIEQVDNNTPYFKVLRDEFVVNFNARVKISNPNFVALTLEKVTAAAYYPALPNTPLGTATKTDISIPARSATVVRFPVTLKYGQGVDPQAKVLVDLANRCKIFTGGQKVPLEVDYKVNVTAKVIAVPVKLPEYPGSATFDCPAEFNRTAPILGGLPI